MIEIMIDIEEVVVEIDMKEEIEEMIETEEMIEIEEVIDIIKLKQKLILDHFFTNISHIIIITK